MAGRVIFCVVVLRTVTRKNVDQMFFFLRGRDGCAIDLPGCSQRLVRNNLAPSLGVVI